MSTTITQKHCPDVTDHVAHPHFEKHASKRLGTCWYSEFRCPGRYTPSAHRAPHPSPAVPSDPFAGIDESTEFDATRPGVS